MLTNEQLIVGEESWHCNAVYHLRRSLRVVIFASMLNADVGYSEADGSSTAQGASA
ncbi:MAG: hypothetical protein WBZ01_14240 [Terriglobales bacterium]|jgi:hypothetical protein